jgi:sulfur relay (sulfurtransferase) DsrF/TusC family protein
MEGKRKCPTLAINEKERAVMVMMYDMCLDQHMGVTAIARRLNEMGFRSRNDNEWTAYTVRGVLTNPHNIGKVYWDRRSTLTQVEDMELRKYRPRKQYGDYLIYDGKHPAAISEERFLEACSRLKGQAPIKDRVKMVNPLAGILYCQCGKPMTYRTYKRNGKERSAPRVLCTNQAVCHTGSCLFDEIIDQVGDILKSSISDFEIQLENSSHHMEEFHGNVIRQLEARIQELDRKEISQWEKYSEEGMPKPIFDKLNEKVLKEKEETKSALKAAYESLPEIVDYREKIVRYTDALNALQDENVSPELKNRYLKSVFTRLDYYREKPVRITKRNYQEYGLRPEDIQTGGNWYAPPFELDITLKV